MTTSADNRYYVNPVDGRVWDSETGRWLEERQSGFQITDAAVVAELLNDGTATREEFVWNPRSESPTDWQAQYPSGMVRDTQTGKPRFDLMFPRDMPYEEQLVTRVGWLLERGGRHYGDRNWEQANGPAELDRFKASAIRHMLQWIMGETDEDHAAAVVFNLMGAEFTKWKMSK